MSLREYRHKRHFTSTPEPGGIKDGTSRSARRPAAIACLHFVVHKHQARSLHYDFRLEWAGVLLSWAVPKGIPTVPAAKRLAVRVEDHPLEYAKFEGRIPEGQYGAGTVEIWDQGEWRPDDNDVNAALRRGELKFRLLGRRLNGTWVLVRTRLSVARSKQETWLLIKRKEDAASRRGDASATAGPRSSTREDAPAPRRAR
ncbi:MAG TPA: DNA polymerase ligase N-terminal domain-containing protein [bacterium]|nr:DNA polymerase ligase N-terminal domain-containing protein [bacterium]